MSELKSLRIEKFQNWEVSELESVRIGECQNWKVSELQERQNWKVSELQECQNWKVSRLESVQKWEVSELESYHAELVQTKINLGLQALKSANILCFLRGKIIHSFCPSLLVSVRFNFLKKSE